jgi:hypothetical protein
MAGPSTHAGFIAAPVSVPPNRMSSVIVAPITRPAIAPWPPLIDCHPINDEHEKESENRFDQNSLPRGEINGELWSASNDDIASEQAEANQGSRDSAETLGDPIAKRVRPFHMTAAKQTEGYCRI